MVEIIKKCIQIILLLLVLCVGGIFVIWILDLILRLNIQDVVREGCMSGLRAWILIVLIMIGKKQKNKC